MATRRSKSPSKTQTEKTGKVSNMGQSERVFVCKQYTFVTWHFSRNCFCCDFTLKLVVFCVNQRNVLHHKSAWLSWFQGYFIDLIHVYQFVGYQWYRSGLLVCNEDPGVYKIQFLLSRNFESTLRDRHMIDKRLCNMERAAIKIKCHGIPGERRTLLRKLEKPLSWQQNLS